MSAETPGSNPTRPPRTLRNAGATLVGRGLGQLTRLAALLVMMAHLSPQSWGVLALVLSALDIAKALTNFGLDTAAIRRMAMHPEAQEGLLRLVLRLKTALGVVGMLGLAVYIGLNGGGLRSPYLLVLAILPITWTSALTARFQADHAMHWLIPVQAAAGGIYFCAVYLAARQGVQLGGFVALVVSVEVVTLVATSIVSARLWPYRPVSTSVVPIGAGAFFREGFPLGILEVVVILYTRLGMFLVKSYGGGAVEAGHLFAALKINEYTVAFAGAIGVSALPVFSRLLHEGRRREVVRSFLRYSMLGAALSVPAALFFTFAGRPLLLYLKPEHADAAAPLRILTWAGVAMFQNNLSIAVINGFGHFRVASACALFNLLVYAVVGAWLIPHYGAQGAAYASLATETLNMVIQLTYVRYQLTRGPDTDPLPTAEPV